MPKYRRDRINDAVTREFSEILRDTKDPRISDVFLTVNSVQVTGDLKFATVYYSTLIDISPDREKELKQGLKSAAPFMRRCLAERLNLRVTPELSFKRDEGVKHGADISALLHKISEEHKAGETQSGEFSDKAANAEEERE